MSRDFWQHFSIGVSGFREAPFRSRGDGKTAPPPGGDSAVFPVGSFSVSIWSLRSY